MIRNLKEKIKAEAKEKVTALIAHLKDVARNTSKGFYIYIVFLMGLISAAAFMEFLFVTVGGGITNSNDFAPWGLFLVAFIFLVGISAGVTVIGLMVYAFGRDGYKPLVVRAIIIGLVCILGAVLNLLMDAGTPLRGSLMPFLFRNATSMLNYTMQTYMFFGLILTAELVFVVRLIMGSKSSLDKKMAKWLAIIAVPFSLVILKAPEGALFAFVKAREYWHSPLLPPHFAVSALVSGLALMIVTSVLLSRIHKREIVDMKILSHMGSLLALFLSINILMDLFDLLILYYTEVPEGMEALHLMTGRFAPSSALHFGAPVICLIMLFTSWGRKTVKGLTIISCLTLAALGAYRYNLIIIPQLIPQQQGLPELHYFPAATEWVAEAGVVALMLFLYAVLTKILPTEEKVQVESNERLGQFEI